MAIIANTFPTYTAAGNREELFDAIWNISPMDRPFTTSIGRRSLESVHPEWQTDALAAVNQANAYLQGDDINPAGAPPDGFEAVVPTVRVGNHTQISRKSLILSRTQERVSHAGRDSELAYQIAKKGNELLRDIESIAVENQVSLAAAAGVVPLTAGVQAWCATNLDMGAGGAAGGFNAGTGLVVAYTPGAGRALTETIFQNAASLAWNSGGNPTLAICTGAHKMAISKFTNTFTPVVGAAGGGALVVRTEDAASRTLHASFDVYAHDFGQLTIMPSRFLTATAPGALFAILMIDPTMWELGWLDTVMVEDLAKTGDADKKMIVCEWAVISKNEAASAVIHDLT